MDSIAYYFASFIFKYKAWLIIIIKMIQKRFNFDNRRLAERRKRHQVYLSLEVANLLKDNTNNRSYTSNSLSLEGSILNILLPPWGGLRLTLCSRGNYCIGWRWNIVIPAFPYVIPAQAGIYLFLLLSKNLHLAPCNYFIKKEGFPQPFVEYKKRDI